MPTVFEDFFKPFNEMFDINGGALWNRVSQVPHVNIVEEPEDYKIEMAAPGFKKEDFNIDLNGNMLIISLDKREEKEEEERNFTRREFNYFNFNRTFNLPDDIKLENINAKYEAGVLKLLLPKKEEAKKLTAKKHIAVL